MKPVELPYTTHRNRPERIIFSGAVAANRRLMMALLVIAGQLAALFAALGLPVADKSLRITERLIPPPVIILSGINHLFPVIHPSFRLITPLLRTVNDLLVPIKPLSPQKKALSGFMIRFLGGFDHSPPKKRGQSAGIILLFFVIKGLLRFINYRFRFIAV